MGKYNRRDDDEIVIEDEEVSDTNSDTSSDVTSGTIKTSDISGDVNIKVQEVTNRGMSDVSNDPILNADVFQNRREMAWWSLFVLIGLTAFLFVFLLVVLGLFVFVPDLMIKLTEQYKVYLEWSGTFIGWGYSAFTAVILAYMGVAAYFYNNYMKYKK